MPDNGDLNPYAVVVAPVSAGKIQKDDVLVTNFNNLSNLQGTGGTIVDYNPATKKTTLFASLPQRLPQCPGGVGLGTAMTMLKSGWVIVGSTPSTDGTTHTKGDGCLLVLDANGQHVATWTGPNINDPWGNMATIDKGATATLFVSMAGFDVPGPEVRDPQTGYPTTVNKATVLRIELAIPEGKPPTITSQTVIADGFGQRADKDAFLIGPTGLALAPDNTLYVSDALANQIVAIPEATTRTTSAGIGRTVTKDGLLKRPLAMVMAPNGNLLVTNAKNGQVVEVNPVSGQAALCPMDRRQPGTVATGQRRPVRHRDDAGRQRLLLRRGRREHLGGGHPMSRRTDGKLRTSRRGFLAAGAGLVAAAGTGLGAGAARQALAETTEPSGPDAESRKQSEPFWGEHQGGIVTPAQSHTYVAAFDLVTTKRDDLVKLLQAWTSAAARMAPGQTAQPLEGGLEPVVVAGGGDGQAKGYDSYETPDWRAVAADSGEALGLPPARLTVTFGFGTGLFIKDGKDRYGLAARRPEALVDMPKFVGDQLVEAHTGGDLSVQACADDAQVAFHAVRQLARLADNAAQLRWAQTGFIPSFGGKETPRNLMGFKDGTNNPSIADPKAMAKSVWVGGEGPDWMSGGSYVVVRRIRIALEHWDRMKVAFQEQTVGRNKYSGAPLGQGEGVRPSRLGRDRQRRQPGHCRECPCPARRRCKQRRRADPPAAVLLQ